MAKFLIILLTLALCSLAQRPYYAFHPIGYPEIIATSTRPQQQSTDDPMGDRFNNGNEEPTKKPFIPAVFEFDPESYYYFLGLPIDQRPFHVINAEQIENSKPQTYALKPNHYAENQANIGDIQ